MVSPDLGNAKQASVLARMLDLPVAAGAKEQHSDASVTISSIIGDVAGREVIVLDDEIALGTAAQQRCDAVGRLIGMRGIALYREVRRPAVQWQLLPRGCHRRVGDGGRSRTGGGQASARQ